MRSCTDDEGLVEDLKRMTATNIHPLCLLPLELIALIYEYLPFSEIRQLSSVCSALLFCHSNDNKFWKEKYELVFQNAIYAEYTRGIMLTSSSTCYKEALAAVKNRLDRAETNLGTTASEMQDYIRRNAKLVVYRNQLHGYIGTALLRYLFRSVTDHADLYQRFRAYAPIIVDDFDPTEREGAKIVLVGSGGVGKTCLCFALKTGHTFNQDFIPSMYYDFELQKQFLKSEYSFPVFDTSGKEEYERVRPRIYPNSSAFLVCFCVVNRSHLKDIVDIWIPEIKQHSPSTPLILVGTQSDLRTDPKTLQSLIENKETLVQYDEAIQFAKQHGFISYIETSAKTLTGVDCIAEIALQATVIHSVFNHRLKVSKKNKIKCRIT